MFYNLSDLDGTKTLTFMAGGTAHVITERHPNWQDINEAVQDPAAGAEEEDLVLELLDATTHIHSAAATAAHAAGVTAPAPTNPATLSEGTADLVDDMLVDAYTGDGSDSAAFAAIAAFRERCSRNPNPDAVHGLDRFIAKNGLPLTADGLIICYKGVSSNLASQHGGSWEHGAWVNGQYSYPIYNTPGTTVALPRHEVVHDPDRACSRGLHVGDKSYWQYAAVPLVVAVDPAHVCSVPRDYSGQKMRVAAYLVVGPYDGAIETNGHAMYNGRTITTTALSVSEIDASAIVDDPNLTVPPAPKHDVGDTAARAATSTAASHAASAATPETPVSEVPVQDAEFPVFITARMAYDRLNYSSWSNFKRAARRAYAAAEADGVVGTQVRGHGTGDYAYSPTGWRYLIDALDGTRPDVQALAAALEAEAENAEHALNPWVTTGKAMYAALNYSSWGNFKRALRRAYNAATTAGITGGITTDDEGDYRIARTGLKYVFGALDTTRDDVREYAEQVGYTLPA